MWGYCQCGTPLADSFNRDEQYMAILANCAVVICFSSDVINEYGRLGAYSHLH